MAGMNDALVPAYSMEPEQFRHARLIIAWGGISSKPTSPLAVHREARRQGAKFTRSILTKPHRKLADRHYAIRPGTDAALALP